MFFTTALESLVKSECDKGFSDRFEKFYSDVECPTDTPVEEPTTIGDTTTANADL